MIILWNVVNIFLESGSNEISIVPFKNNVELLSATKTAQGDVNLMVRKTNGVDELTELHIYLQDEDEQIYSIKKTEGLPGLLETRTITINADEIGADAEIVLISIIPVLSGKAGLESNSLNPLDFIPICKDADLDNDHIIGFGDLSLFGACFLETPLTEGCRNRDFNRDGVVNFADFEFFDSCFNQRV